MRLPPHSRNPGTDATPDPRRWPWNTIWAAIAALTALLPILVPLLAVIYIGGTAPPAPAVVLIDEPRPHTVVHQDTGSITGQVRGLSPAANLHLAYRRPDQASLTVSPEICVVVESGFRCPPLRLPAVGLDQIDLQIVVVEISRTLRERLSGFALDTGAPVTLHLPRSVERAHILVRCS